MSSEADAVQRLMGKISEDVPELAEWLASSAHLALSLGHWFGREGAGFARMTIAAPDQNR